MFSPNHSTSTDTTWYQYQYQYHDQTSIHMLWRWNRSTSTATAQLAHIFISPTSTTRQDHVIIIVMVMVMIIIFFSYHFTFVNFCANSRASLCLHVQQVCVRREKGFCKIGWIQTSDTDSFKLSRPSTNYKVYFCISKIVIFYILGRHPVWQWLRQRLHKVTQNIRKDQKDHNYY